MILEQAAKQDGFPVLDVLNLRQWDCTGRNFLEGLEVRSVSSRARSGWQQEC